MRPMLGREVVEGKQHFFIFLQAFAGFWEFALVTGDELVVGCQSCFAGRRQVHFMDQLLSFALNALGHRSEEHTSELQSHLNLVCRLLLEKKKQMLSSAT